MKAKYLGLDLSSPIVVSSSPYTASIGNVEQCVRNGAGAVVLNEVPPYCTVVGVPGRIVRRYCPENPTGAPCEQCETCSMMIESSDLDQVHMPDPVEEELQALREKVDILEKAVKILIREEQDENF